ncbi:MULTISPECIES: PEPxxWA-CTERM sorting domain-containing protein [Phenylobacterium]|uniref:F5/8 type C domain-containing protein n=1 Tax=Phenylobacterium koreense TaxID=266125 RepID=A0ABV2EIA1_9CAUL
MSIKISGLAALATAAALFAAPASAAVITPVSVTASNTFLLFGEYKAENLINGSGMVGDQHDANYANMWMTDLSVDAATLTFDLGGLYQLSSVDVWNYNFGKEEFASTLDRAAKAFTLAISTDGVSFTDVLSGEFARGAGELLGAETFGLSGQARYVQLSLSGNHQQYPEIYGYAPVGLSEVRFGGSSAPEPATWAMLIAGFGLVGGVIRTRRTQPRLA